MGAGGQIRSSRPNNHRDLEEEFFSNLREAIHRADRNGNSMSTGTTTQTEHSSDLDLLPVLLEQRRRGNPTWEIDMNEIDSDDDDE
jgi:hypothetical protein